MTLSKQGFKKTLKNRGIFSCRLKALKSLSNFIFWSIGGTKFESFIGTVVPSYTQSQKYDFETGFDLIKC